MQSPFTQRIATHSPFTRLIQLVELALRTATSIADKVPEPQDPPLTKITKTLAMIDAVRSVYRAGKNGYMRDMTDMYGLKTRTSEAFVRMFFGTELHTLFEITRIDLEHHTVILARHGTDLLFFEEHRWSTAVVASTFYHTPGFDFARATERLWDRYRNGLYLSVDASERGYGHDMTFAAVPRLDIVHLTTRAAARLEEQLSNHEKAQRRGRHRTYLCVGEPGSGKSAFAVLFAQRVGGRPLKVDAAALPHMGVRETAFMIETLRPSALIIDDLDRAPMDAVSARVLFILELIKGTFPTIPVILTVNDVTKLDRALLRPCRVEVPLVFDKPDPSEQRELLGPFAETIPLLNAADTALPPSPTLTLADLFTAPVELSHAYLAEVAARLRDEPEGDVVRSVLLLRELSQKATGGSKTPPLPPSPPSGP